MREILETYAQHGVPEELVTAAKRREVADAEFERNSIPGLANVWSNAIAAEGRASPDEDVAAIQRVTVDDVNRVARQYLDAASSITATLKPVPSGQPVASKGFGGAEQVTAAADRARAAAALGERRPRSPRGTERAPGRVGYDAAERPAPHRQDRPHQPHHLRERLGEARLRSANAARQRWRRGGLELVVLLWHADARPARVQKALDDIAANETAGYSFSVTVLKADFSRGVELLADNELRPGAARRRRSPS